MKDEELKDLIFKKIHESLKTLRSRIDALEEVSDKIDGDSFLALNTICNGVLDCTLCEFRYECDEDKNCLDYYLAKYKEQ